MVTIAMTFAASVAATAGIGDFRYAPRTNAGRTLARTSPLVSLWRGAPSGVIIDRSVGRAIDLRRRLVHAIPYGLAVGAWVLTPVPGLVGDAAGELVGVASAHPYAAAVVVTAAIAVGAVLFRRAHLAASGGDRQV